ncbi:exopolysaccharide biosynthesis polyprenyl glycosylphosphotransferase [Winogradskyella aurantiaca]|uniref:exopolysaccharide biosynthesis polyprenyl glycosylphosphotransferase n=1 Tax=Winogradskyella aurantiaca TaxID=2219558 RepID=UPI000E1C5741|nr:exopolysaccharide biosynthesis polyprenyl glycosylphosphotransferase [Winogradskyella aurantiaca]
MTHQKGIHFEVSERKLLLRVMDLFMIGFGIYLLPFIVDFEYLIYTQENAIAFAVLAIYFSIFATVFELYELFPASKFYLTFRNAVMCLSVVVLFYLLTPRITPFLPEDRIQILYFYIGILLMLLLGRLLYIGLLQSPRFYKRVLLVGEVTQMGNVLKSLKKHSPNFQIVGFVNSEQDEEERISFKGLTQFPGQQLIDILIDEQVSEVIVAHFNAESMNDDIYDQLLLLMERGFKVRDFTQVYEELLFRVPIQYIGKDFYKYFPFSRNNENQLYLFFRRVFDIILSLIGLLIGVLLSPFIILGNFMGNKGPLFYSQVRIGQHGRPFNIHKLRTMVPNAENGKAQWAQKGDLRITTFGNFLRRTRLDELPQFWNVLKGDMSFIGPRPERPYFVKALAESLAFYEARHIIKPGLTGWAQVKSRYGASIDDSRLKLQYDLYYIKHRGIFLDLNIFVKTISTVLYYRGQ